MLGHFYKMLEDFHRVWTKGICLDNLWQRINHFGVTFFFFVFLMLEIENAVFG